MCIRDSIKGGAEAVRSAKAKDGYAGKSDWEWGVSGGQERFLKDSANWNNGMSLDAYLNSPEAQDGAFRAVSNKAYEDWSRKGVIDANTPQSVIAGMMKARHISGAGAAVQAKKGIAGRADVNGTNNMTYYNHLANGSAYITAFKSKPVAPQITTPPVSTSQAIPVATAPSFTSSKLPTTPVAEKVADATPVTSQDGKGRAAASVAGQQPSRRVEEGTIAWAAGGGLGMNPLGSLGK